MTSSIPEGQRESQRTAGTPNRKTTEIAELLESLGCDPIQGMAKSRLTAPE
jgi:hypothetical protein